MRLYPDARGRRLSALVRDACALFALLLLVWLGVAVHDAVDRLAALGEGVRGAGGAVRGGFDRAAGGVGGTPLVGGRLAEALREAGAATGGNVEDAGTRGEDAAHDLADVLGVLFFGLPAVLVLALWLPRRVAEVRTLTAASRALAAPSDPERARLIAMRAALGLPYAELVRHTADPLGDLAAGRYDALLEAAFEQAGLRPPARTASAEP